MTVKEGEELGRRLATPLIMLTSSICFGVYGHSVLLGVGVFTAFMALSGLLSAYMSKRR